MLGDSTAIACFSTPSIEKAREFYCDKLGIASSYSDAGSLVLALAEGTHVLIYEKEDHAPANYTTLVLSVEDVSATVAKLKELGIEFADLEYTDEDGIARDADMPPTAWFADPFGNWIAVGEVPADW